MRGGGGLETAGTGGAIISAITGGIIMGVVAMVYAELVSAIPKAGGEHHYLLRGMGARWSFIGSWGITGGYISIVAFEAVALPRTVAYLWPQIESIPLWTLFDSEVYLVWALVGAGAAIIVTWVNYIGVKMAGIVQTMVVLVLLAIGALLAFGSATGGTLANMEPMFTSATGLFTVLIVVPFLFVGFDVIPQSAEELRMPPRRMGIMILVSVLAATLWYVMVILTTSSSMDRVTMAEANLVTADAMGALFNSPTMANVLLIGGIAGILTSWIALLMGAARLMYAMGVSGMLPRWFGRLHPKYGTPGNAVLFIGALSVIAPFFGSAALGWFVDSGSPSIVLTYLMVCVVFVVLRRREPGMDRPFRAGGPRAGTVLGVVGAILTAGLLSLYIPGMPASIDPMSYVFLGLWWALGLVFLLRIPRGIAPGEDAEERLLERLRR
ncbi:MAG: APC family permease [Micrococcus sp.]|nr:APC family permease [Micrococcus sp.]